MRFLLLKSFILSILFSSQILGQVIPDTLIEYSPSINNWQLPEEPKKFKDFSSNLYFNSPIDIIGEELAYPIPGSPFTPSLPYQNIGDINGDGVTDFLQNGSLVYFGKESIFLQPDQTLKGSTFLALGDINGDGYSDGMEIFHFEQNTLYQGSDNGLIEVASSDFQDFSLEHFRNNVQTNLDINGDGFSDIISSYTRSFGTYSIRYQSIVYGHPDIFEDGFTAHGTLITNNAGVTGGRGLIDAFTINEKTYVIFETCERIPIDEFNFENRTSVGIFVQSEQDSLSSLNTIVLPYYDFNSECRGSIRYFAEDINNDTFVDMVYKIGSNVIVQPGTGIENDTLTFASNLTGTSEDFLITGITNLHFLGDIDGDNTPEFYVFKDGQTTIEIGNFSNSEDLPVWNSLLTIDSDDFLPDSYFTDGGNIFRIYNTKYSSIGAAPDNNLRLPFGVINDTTFQKGFFVFDPDAENPLSSHTIDIEEFQRENFSRILRKELFYLGDLEDDGVDNFAVWEERWNGEFIVYRNGFYDSNPKEYSIPDSLYLKTIIGGNFLDTDDKHVAHLFADGVGRLSTTKTYIHFYSPDLLGNELSYSNQMSSDVQLMNNLGDINNDGFDDLGLATPLGSNDFRIYKGGNELSDGPDFVRTAYQYNESLREGLGFGSIWGINQIQTVGDVNNDNIEDFVISDATIIKYYDEAFNKFTDGSIYLFYGANDLIDFGTPDLELLPDTSNFTLGDYSYFGGFNEIAYGDFDGDGHIDIAGKSASHQNREETDGVAAIHIFYGENGYNSLPDTTIKIRNEYVRTEFNSVENEYTRFMFRALLKAVDTNNDGKDELLMVSGGGFSNAVLYDIEGDSSETAFKLFSGLYPLPINPSGNFVNKQYNSNVGDFVGDGGLYFLGSHTYSTYRDTPIMLFDLINSGTLSGEFDPEIPQSIVLEQNYPNPFNPSTVISFFLRRPENIQLAVYNVLGQKVATIVDERLNSGPHSFTFNSGSLASGIYFYRLETDDLSETRKMTLIR